MLTDRVEIAKVICPDAYTEWADEQIAYCEHWKITGSTYIGVQLGKLRADALAKADKILGIA